MLQPHLGSADSSSRARDTPSSGTGSMGLAGLRLNTPSTAGQSQGSHMGSAPPTQHGAATSAPWAFNQVAAAMQNSDNDGGEPTSASAEPTDSMPQPLYILVQLMLDVFLTFHRMSSAGWEAKERVSAALHGQDV